MTESSLDGPIIHSEAMEVRCETAPERMPPTPTLTTRGEDRFDVTFRERVEIEEVCGTRKPNSGTRDPATESAANRQQSTPQEHDRAWFRRGSSTADRCRPYDIPVD